MGVSQWGEVIGMIDWVACRSACRSAGHVILQEGRRGGVWSSVVMFGQIWGIVTITVHWVKLSGQVNRVTPCMWWGIRDICRQRNLYNM